MGEETRNSSKLQKSRASNLDRDPDLHKLLKGPGRGAPTPANNRPSTNQTNRTNPDRSHPSREGPQALDVLQPS